MTKEYIEALGNLLGTYDSDLIYILNFQRYKTGIIDKTEYLRKENRSFKSFINEFKVARNIEKTKTDILLNLTTEWIKDEDFNNVDKFAEILRNKGITHGKTMTSLASKVLFLNNPWEILPIDNLAKQALGQKSNLYSDYIPLTQKFIEINDKKIIACLQTINEHLKIIESTYVDEIDNITTIRKNRFIYKILWTNGKKNKNQLVTKAIAHMPQPTGGSLCYVCIGCGNR